MSQSHEHRIDTETRRATSAFVVLNARSGGCDARAVRAMLEKHLAEVGIACGVYEPEHGESMLRERIREAVDSGCDLLVAAGGDGTVSAVADALVEIGAGAPLGIIPLGTANVLSGELGIPADLDAAIALLAGEHALTRIDAMEVNGKHAFTQVGVGLDAEMIRDTRDEHKRRFGRVAYLWTFATRLLGLRSRHVSLTVDGETIRGRRSMQVLVCNSGTLGARPFRWGPDIRPDDGRLDVCQIRGRAPADFLSIGWHFLRGQHVRSPNVTYLPAYQSVTIATRRPLPVQADGEIVGTTPVTVRLVAGVVRVVVPKRPSQTM